MSELM